MESIIAHLHKATDAEDSYALKLEGDQESLWRAERGYGSAFRKEWTVELQSSDRPDVRLVDWEAVLDRIIEAYDLNDPVIAGFVWPMKQPA